MSERSPHVVIIGAGLGGACLAHGLKRAGISVAVYDRQPTRGDGSSGLRVAIGEAGCRALREALPLDLYQTFIAICADSPQHLTIYSEGLNELFSAGIPAAEQKDGGAASVMRFASPKTLRQLLLTGIEDTVRFGKEFIRYMSLPDGRIRVFFADGTFVDGDVLVGADGSHSRVRRQYQPDPHIQDAGFFSAYGQVALGEAAAVLPREKMHRGISLVRGRNGLTFAVQSMVFKWDRDRELKSRVSGFDAALIKSWPGLRFDNSADGLVWGLAGPSRRLGVAPEKHGGTEFLAALTELTGSWHPALQSLVRMTDPATVVATRSVAVGPIDPSKATEIALLGDARQVAISRSCAGGDATLQAAVLLYRLLSDAVTHRRPIVGAIRDYEAYMLGSDSDLNRVYQKCLNREARMQKPVVGPLLAAGVHAGLRVANLVPSLKKRVVGGPGVLSWGLN